MMTANTLSDLPLEHLGGYTERQLFNAIYTSFERKFKHSTLFQHSQNPHASLSKPSECSVIDDTVALPIEGVKHVLSSQLIDWLRANYHAACECETYTSSGASQSLIIRIPLEAGQWMLDGGRKRKPSRLETCVQEFTRPSNLILLIMTLLFFYVSYLLFDMDPAQRQEIFSWIFSKIFGTPPPTLRSTTAAATVQPHADATPPSPAAK